MDDMTYTLTAWAIVIVAMALILAEHFEEYFYSIKRKGK
jgi:hypothetical protein